MTPRWLVGTVAAALLSVTAAAQTPQGQVPAAQTSLGSVQIPRAVMANGQPLRAGTYQVRLTAESPAATPGIAMDRWVEFVQGGKVVGREVVSIVPPSEVELMHSRTRGGPRPAAGSSRVEMLKGDDFLRVWINRGGVNYLIHMPPATA